MFTEPERYPVTLAYLVMAMFNTSFGLSQETNGADTNRYKICSFAEDRQPGKPPDPFHCLYSESAGPFVEELPAALDKEGHWGAAAGGWQLSLRLRRKELLPGEPVFPLVLLRNLAREPREIGVKFAVQANFRLVVRRGADELTPTWVEPKPPEPRPIGYWATRDGYPVTVPAQSQVAFFVPLDNVFDLKQLGEYSVEVRREERASSGQGRTNVFAGVATFRVVEKLSPSEIAATNAFAIHSEEARSRFLSTWLKPPAKGSTNRPPDK